MAVKKTQRCRTRAPALHKPLQRLVKSKEQPQKQETSGNDRDGKAVVIAHEIKFARLLASNDRVTRDRVLKKLRKWLTVRSQSSFAFTESDFMRLWKGLFYCMWMSDKPLVQEELTESLSKIVHCFKPKDVALLYTMCALRTLGIEWLGIDQYRLDKFYMLTRRILRQTFEKCKANLWDMEWIKGLCEVLENLLGDPKISIGFNMHITEIFLEELSKISGGDVPVNVITELIKPFVTYFVPMDDERQIRHVMRHVFRYLIIQSDVGMDYAEKFRAWRDAGFPAGSIDAMEKIELSDEEMTDGNAGDAKFLENRTEDKKETLLDPRAGRVNVDLPQIPFDAKQIADLLNQYKFHPSSTTKSRRQLRRLIKEFTEVSQGKMPLGIKEISVPDKRKKDTDSKAAAIRLLKFEKELYSDRPLKKRKRKSPEQDAGLDESDKSDDDVDHDDGETDSESTGGDTDESEITRKKGKTKQPKVDGADASISAPATQTLGEPGASSKRKKCMAKEKNQSSAFEANEEDDATCKSTKKCSQVLGKGATESRKAKLKRNKMVAAKLLNVVAQAKRKKLAKSKVPGKWDVSDNVDSPIASQVNGTGTDASAKPAGESPANGYEQRNDTQLAWFASIFTKLENKKKKPAATSSKGQRKRMVSESSKKRVKIALQRNTAQHTSEYMLQIRRSPAIPFDANRKPLVGVLKASPIPSPINPFYRRNI